MKRRTYLSLLGSANTIALAGCSTDGGLAETKENPIQYNINPQNFEINATVVSKNAPTEIGVTVSIESKQLPYATIGLEVWLLDANQNPVFHKPVIGVSVTGGGENIETIWFNVHSKEALAKTYIPKVRIRTEPPS